MSKVTVNDEHKHLYIARWEKCEAPYSYKSSLQPTKYNVRGFLPYWRSLHMCVCILLLSNRLEVNGNKRNHKVAETNFSQVKNKMKFVASWRICMCFKRKWNIFWHSFAFTLYNSGQSVFAKFVSFISCPVVRYKKNTTQMGNQNY